MRPWRPDHPAISLATRTALLTLVVGHLLTPVTGAAQSPLTLREAVARALLQNHDVRLARLRLDSTRAERTVARQLPNPTITATPGLPAQFEATIPLDVGPTRHFRTQVGALGASAAELDLADAERQVRFAVRAAFADVVLADSLRAVAEGQAEIFRRLLAADSSRLRTGSIPERDIATTRLQLAHAEAAAARAVAVSHAARIALAIACGSDQPDTALAVAGVLSFRGVDSLPDEATLVARALMRPDAHAAMLRVHQSAAARSLTRASLLPVPTVGLAWQPAQPFASGAHYAPAVGVTVPIFSLSRGERQRAEAGLATANVVEERTLMQARAEIQGALDAYRSSRMLAERYACGLSADAESALTAARYAYDRGATSLVDLLDAVRTYGDTRTDALTAGHDYWVSVFALERATATDVVADQPPSGSAPSPACTRGATTDSHHSMP